jgi:hypothetical protein
MSDAVMSYATEQDYSKRIWGANCKIGRREDEMVFLCDNEK